MARRSEHSREELMEMAVQAGISLITERGFNHFSARAIANKMGYTVGTIYHLFGTLDHFILHINARTLEEWYHWMQPHQHITALAHAYFSFANTHPKRFNALFEHHLESGNDIPDWYQQKMERLFMLVEQALHSHISDTTQIKHYAKTLWAGIHGICVLSLSGKLEVVGADSPETLADTLIAGLLSG